MESHSSQVVVPRVAPSTAPDTWEGRNLYVKHMPPANVFTMEMPNEFHVTNLFSRFGPIESVRVLRDRASGRPVGVAFVLFETAAAANVAVQELNGYCGMQICHWMPRSRRYAGAAGVGAVGVPGVGAVGAPPPSQTAPAAPCQVDPDIAAEQLFGEVVDILDEERSDLAPKITGMLLELDANEIGLLLNDPAALQKRIDEALVLLGRN